jgi:hypothetical protein
MDEQIIPFQVSKGVVVCGSFRGEIDESVYVWIRRFESEEQREAQSKVVYEDDRWKTNVEPIWRDYHRREDIVVTRLVATPCSPFSSSIAATANATHLDRKQAGMTRAACRLSRHGRGPIV